MSDVHMTNSEFDRSPAGALRLTDAGMVIIAGPDGDRAWLTPPGTHESEEVPDDQA